MFEVMLLLGMVMVFAGLCLHGVYRKHFPDKSFDKYYDESVR